jgi:YggT family protein
MISGALVFLVETTGGLFTLALLLRFYLQWARAPYRNPLSEFLHALTDFAVRPARRIIPGAWGLDMASLLLAYLVQAVQLFIVFQLKGYPIAAAAGPAIGGILLLAVILVLKLGIYIVMAAVIVQAVLSWVNPYSPIAPLLNGMTRPFLRFFQRRLKPVGNVDLSALFVIIICQLLLIVPIAFLEASVARFF